MTTQLDIFSPPTGQELRDQGISRAVKKADKDNPGWSGAAYQKIIEFLNQHTGEFMCEDVRAFAAMDDNFSLPEKGQAWAGPLAKIKEAGLIEFVRWQPIKNKAGHGRPGAVWRKSNYQ